MIKRFVIAVILLAIVVGGLVGFNLFREKMIGEFFANMPVQPATVSTVEAKPVTWSPVIEAIGTVNASQGVDLTVETAGVIKEIPFASNQEVEQGTLLLQLDDVVQRADVEAARTQHELDRQNLERARELQRRGVATSVSLETSESASRASEAQLARAIAVLEQRQLVAPFPGVAGIPRVDVGQYIAPGTTVATLQDLDTMRVDFTVPEQRMRELSIGQKITLLVEGLDKQFPGEISGINPRVDPQSRLVQVRGAVANSDHELTPGTFVRVHVQLPDQSGVIALPHTAVVTSLFGDYVFLVQPKADAADQLEVRQHFVTVGRRSGQLTEVVDGVKAGDQVVTAGQNRLRSGLPAIVNNDVNPAEGATGAAVRNGAGTEGGAGQ